ncbi:MAG: DNA polymerase domain-containing protein [Thermoplasmatota archaeon]
MLRIQPFSFHDLRAVATDLRKAIRCHGYRFYDVDHVVESRWMAENGLYPLARLNHGLDGPLVAADPAERVAYDAALPPLVDLDLAVTARSEGTVPSFDDPLDSIRLGAKVLECAGPKDERRVLRQLGRLLRAEDPDVLLTRGGDAWDVPYLLRRIRKHRLEDEVMLGRLPDPDPETPDMTSSSTMTYGRIRYRGEAFYLRGRWHVDLSKKSLDDLPDREGLHGILHVARLCNRRVQEVARTGPGAALQQRQIDVARSMGCVLPWKRNLAEREKDLLTLARLDRGGQIFFPKPGIYEDVWACDFSAYYPSIVTAYNLSSDSLECACCPDAPTIPDLGMRVCEKVDSHQRQVLQPIVDHRRRIKVLLRDPATPPSKRAWGEAIKGELKGMGVVCFGYFRYRNARYGCAEVHQGIQAYGRTGMTRSKEIAEEHGFEVLHALTDCLLLRKPGAPESEVRDVLAAIERELKLPMDIEGHYDWVVLLPRNHEPDVGVPNRYYGRFAGGDLKTRGIEVRRHDTAPFIRQAQKDMLAALGEARHLALAVAHAAARLIRERRVPAHELSIRVRASRAADEYRSQTAAAAGLKELAAAGVAIEPGQAFEVILTASGSGKAAGSRGVASLLHGGEAMRYDVEAYLKRLARAAQGILAPFGVREAALAQAWLKGVKPRVVAARSMPPDQPQRSPIPTD